MPATQDDMTTCFDSFKKDRFCSFPHRHGAATGKPETRDETRGSIKTSISCETSSNFHTFVASGSTFSYEFSYEPPNLLPENRCFLRGFRQFSRDLTKCHTCHGICTLSPLDAALTIRFAKNTQHHTPQVLRLPCKMTMMVSKVLRLPRKMQRISWKRRKSIAPATQNDFRLVIKQVGISQSAMPATQDDMTTCFDSFKKDRFCSFPHRHGAATGKPETRDETRGSIKTSISCETSSNFHTFVASGSTFSYEFSYEPPNLLPENRCFLRGFRQFSRDLTKCHTCHGICTLSPLDAALTIRFAKNTQHHTPQVLRLPCKMTMMVSKVLRLPRKMQRISWKRRKSIAPAT